MEYLQGGRENKIVRLHEVVQRPSGFWTKSVHALLNHVRARGFLHVPQPLGFDENGHELVTFIAGEVSNYPLSQTAASTEALTSAARLLRAYHDATVSFVQKGLSEHAWFLPIKEPVEVICHGDFAPYNVVLHGETAVAIIDFDTAHPAPRKWDIAYALYRWSPLKNRHNPDSIGTLETQIRRARLFCDAYGLASEQRVNMVTVIIERLQTLVNLMQTEAQKGNEAFQANLAAGHHLSYLADISYLQQNRSQIEAGLG